MKIETLNERIKNAELKIEKKQNTICKKESLIEKKTMVLQKKGFTTESDKRTVAESDRDAYWLLCEIGYLKQDIKRLHNEISEISENLEKYKKQLSGEIEKESILLKEIPESMKRMQFELVERWDGFDKDRRNRMREAYKELGWKEYCSRYHGQDLHFKDKTDEQIHNDNVQSAKYLMLDMYYRVKNITGEIIDWSHIRACQGSCGFTVLNGYVIGKEGRASVESILAGGYNIQRLHVRVLVKEYN